MAFHGGERREIKKSYYVWFLGAKESKGLRGDQHIRSILKELLEEEKQFEPAKVTLQVSSKGLKITENVPRQNSREKTEQNRHFIPHDAITYVTQESKPNDDIVCAILLVYNPLTKCPFHVHCYRCDSVETGTTLSNQLKALTDRPENQKKLREIETRLEGLLPYRTLSSDGRSIMTEGSDPTDDSLYSDRDIPGKSKENINSLYDSLAAELREKLNNHNSCPILLPPKDYDPISRRQGNLRGIEKRRSTNFHIIGVNQRLTSFSTTQNETRDSGSSGNSSGIGSDDALSSVIQEVTSHLEYERKRTDLAMSSDVEDWQDSLAQGKDLILPQWKKGVPPVHHKYRKSSPTLVPKEPQPILPNHLEKNAVSGSSQDDWCSRCEKYTDSQDAFNSDRVGCSSKIEALTNSTDNTRPFSYHILKQEDISSRLKKSDLDSHVVYKQKSPDPPSSGRMNFRPVSFPSTNTVTGNRSLSTSFNSYTSHPDYSRKLRPVERQRSNPVSGGLNQNNEFLPGRYFSLRPRTETHHSPFYDERSQQLSPVCHVNQTYRRDDNLHTDKHPFVSLGKPRSAKTPGDIVSKCPVERHTENLRQLQYSPEERHKSGYFELPINPREYRHSIAEPLNRRLPLNLR
ncbi:uncharacterized protein LOC143253323 [Tachypleus tridentatus]|uniref:uncharacterized protein LOC143253323 n=1 Tax=Tachypleus tridentatus TaxID=6853 RepID=UPI003FD0276F